MTKTIADTGHSLQTRKIHAIVSKTHLPRTLVFFGYSAIVAAILLPDNVLTVVFAFLVNIIFPFAARYLASRSDNPLAAGIRVLQADAFFTGLNIAFVAFRLIPSLAMLTMVSGTLMLMGGVKFVRSAWIVGVGALIGLLVFDFEPLAELNTPGIAATLLTVVVFILTLAYSSNATTKDAIAAKKQLGRQNKKVLEQSETLSAINAITRAVNVSLRLDDVVKAVMAGLQQIFSFDLMGVSLIDKKRNELVLDREVGTGDYDLNFQGLSIPLKNRTSVFAHTVRTAKPVYLPKISESDRDKMCVPDRAIYDVAPAVSLLIVPLIVEKKVIGTISFTNSTDEFELDEQDIEKIEEYVAQLATAIRNARLFEEARIARLEALAATETKSQFLANMSHELRTPMNAVIGYSEMLEEEAEEEGLTDFIPDLQKIQSAGRHLLELINGILDLSKIEANKMELYLEDSDVGQMVDGVASTVKPLVAKNNNQLEIERDTELGSMHADVTKIRQSLLNLLSNAAKFSENGVIRLASHRETLPDGDWLTFSVSDTGIGMNEEQLKKLFQPFTQADASTTRKYGGTGLGLTISKRFCEMMGGDIIAKSTPGQGSTFTIKIPAIVKQDSSESPVT